VDAYGNLVTGLRAEAFSKDAIFEITGERLGHRRVFGEAAVGELFWYRNSMDLVEIAANADSAASLLGAGVGASVEEV
jgi:S-adenosylmethionine hydrolase